MKSKLTILIGILSCSFASAQNMPVQAQDTIEPGSKSLNRQYLQLRNVFEKLSWFDSSGNLVRQRVLNLVTRVDSLNKQLIFLQIRNDGYKDSTISEWPSLKPVYTEENLWGALSDFDHRAGNSIRLTKLKNGKTESDTSFTVGSPHFDGFLTDYLLGALPLKPGYHGRFVLGGSHVTTVTIKDVFTDELIAGDGHAIQANMVLVDFNNKVKVMYWFDKFTGEMLKSISRADDGTVFMKSKI
jgi:hypothetical protein